MAITSNSTPTKNQSYVSNNTLTVTHTVNSGTDRIMRIAIGFRDAANDRSVSSITWQGSSTGITQVSGALKRGSSQKWAVDVWYLVAPATGTNQSLVVTLDGNVDRIFAVHVDTLDGVHQTTPVGTPVTALTTTGSISASATAAAGSNTLALGGGFSSLSDPNGWTSSNTALQKSNIGGTNEYVATAYDTGANPTLTFTDSTGFGLESVLTVVPFLEAGGGGGGSRGHLNDGKLVGRGTLLKGLAR